jgi:chromate transporter
LFFDAFLSLTEVACAFKGIQIAVIYLILSAGLRMLKKMKKTPLAWVILLATMLCMVTLTLLSVKLSTVVYILASGIAGVALWLIRRLRRGEKGGEA